MGWFSVFEANGVEGNEAGRVEQLQEEERAQLEANKVEDDETGRVEQHREEKARIEAIEVERKHDLTPVKTHETVESQNSKKIVIYILLYILLTLMSWHIRIEAN